MSYEDFTKKPQKTRKKEKKMFSRNSLITNEL